MSLPSALPNRAHILALAIALLLPWLAGCSGMGAPGGALAAAMGPGTITPAEQARFAAMSCGEIQSNIASYQMGLQVSAGGKGKPGQAAMVAQIIAPRLALLKQLANQKAC